MRICFDISEDLSYRFRMYLLKQHRTTYGVQQSVLREALLEYLDARETSTAQPRIEKESTKRGKGPAPLEVRDPDLAAKIVAYYGAGKREGGHSRSETALEFGIGKGQVDKIIRREKEKIK